MASFTIPATALEEAAAAEMYQRQSFFETNQVEWKRIYDAYHG